MGRNIFVRIRPEISLNINRNQAIHYSLSFYLCNWDFNQLDREGQHGFFILSAERRADYVSAIFLIKINADILNWISQSET